MRITQWGEYGIHFSAYIARRTSEGHPTVGAAEIAFAMHIDLQYAQQILQRLRKGGIVDSVRGPSGGYRLRRPGAELSLFDILCATEGGTLEVHNDTDVSAVERSASAAAKGLTAIMRDFKSYMDVYLRNCVLDELAKMPEYARREAVNDSPSTPSPVFETGQSHASA